MEHKKRAVDFLINAFLSFFGSGLMPFAPGTFGSLAAIPFLYYFYPIFPIYIYSLCLVALLIISVAAASYSMKQTGEDDPGWIVIDEVIGMMVAWPSLKSFNFLEILTLFTLFRIFDIVKIWPASHYDKKHTALGVMMDDIISGVYTMIVMLALHQMIKFPGIL